MLSKCCVVGRQLQSLAVPEHWMRQLFMAHACFEIQLNEEALKLYMALRDNGFSKSTYVRAQSALVHHSLRGQSSAHYNITFNKMCNALNNIQKCVARWRYNGTVRKVQHFYTVKCV